ncbi:MAG: hypothetical protein OXG46_13555 [Chloroflexi bacterium]|nr:hypothetical protein [Chloroflexota bacterium]MCY3937134.1 hypothetical protein [Chloroflexota bacterium]
MAIPFLSGSVIRIVTEKVLANVLEQLPRAIASNPTAGPVEQSSVVAANVAAIGALNREQEKVRGSIDRIERRIEKLESRVRWRTYVWLAVTALIVYGIGFGTAIGLNAAGLI